MKLLCTWLKRKPSRGWCWFEQSWYDQPCACPLSGGLYCSRCHAAWQFCPIDWCLDLNAPHSFVTWCLAPCTNILANETLSLSFPTFFVRQTCPIADTTCAWFLHQCVPFLLFSPLGIEFFPQLFGCFFGPLFGSLTCCLFEGVFFHARCRSPLRVRLAGRTALALLRLASSNCFSNVQG